MVSLLILTLTGRPRPHSPERCSQLTTDVGNVGLHSSYHRAAPQPSLSLSLELTSPPHTSHLSLQTIRRERERACPVLLLDNQNHCMGVTKPLTGKSLTERLIILLVFTSALRTVRPVRQVRPAPIKCILCWNYLGDKEYKTGEQINLSYIPV